MYEPIYPPILAPAALDLSDVRFGISHLHTFRDPDDPTIEPVHVHPYPEFFINISGEVRFLINNRLHPVRNHDVVIARAGDTHMCVFQKAAVHESICLWVDAKEDSPLCAFLKKASFSVPVCASSISLCILWRNIGIRYQLVVLAKGIGSVL